MITQLYQMAVRYDRHRKSRQSVALASPVVSVGGITAGGSGKTPFISWLLERIPDDVEPIILSRGYGRAASAPTNVVVAAGELDDEERRVRELGDENALLYTRMSRGFIGVGSDRVASYRIVEKLLTPGLKPLVILDDGFQHHRIRLDLDIVLLDSDLLTDRRTLPFGRLREPIEGIGRADLILIHSPELLPLVRRQIPASSPVPILTVERIATAPQEIVGGEPLSRGRSFVLVTGIARSERVVDDLLHLRFVPELHLNFADHYRYDRNDVAGILREMEHVGADAIVTTEKDLVKLRAFPALNGKLFLLPLTLRIEEEETVRGIVDESIRRRTDRRISST